ncbi:HIT family protein [Aurantimonas sp. A2-1-M11]|uniref:HIT family protein n=1 Tax=Aurantimonas sp. A2-1-M11 TaxID=3113712 RepID=UPI002F94E353
MSGYDDTNIFAKILRGEIPSQKLYEDDSALAIMDVMPESKGHCLVLPKAASRNILDVDDRTLCDVMPVVAKLARAVKTAFDADGVRIAQFNEAAGGQTVFHLHFHVVPIYAGVPLKKHTEGMADPDMLAEQAALIRAALG